MKISLRMEENHNYMEVGAMKHYNSTKSVSIFDEVESLFDSILGETFPSSAFTSVRTTKLNPVQKAIKGICSNAFPPSDIYVENDKLKIEVACAGYGPKDVSISFEDHYLIVSFKTENDTKNKSYIQRGIKRSESETRYYIPEKYDANLIEASFSNGLLSMSIPLKPESKPKQINIEVK